MAIRTCGQCGDRYESGSSLGWLICASCVRVNKASKDADRREADRAAHAAEQREADERAVRMQDYVSRSEAADSRVAAREAAKAAANRALQKARGFSASGLFDDALRLVVSYIDEHPDDPAGPVELLRIGAKAARPDLSAFASESFVRLVHERMADFDQTLFVEPTHGLLKEGIALLQSNGCDDAGPLAIEFARQAQIAEDPLLSQAESFLARRRAIFAEDLTAHFGISGSRAKALISELKTRRLIRFDGQVLGGPAPEPFTSGEIRHSPSQSQHRSARFWHNLFNSIAVVLGGAAALYAFARWH